MKRPTLTSMLSSVGNAAGQVTGALNAHAWLEQNRERLLALIESGAAVEAACLLNDFCAAYPLMAGAVINAMGGSPEQAITAITFFDANLGSELLRVRDNFARAQVAFGQLSH